MTAICLVTGKSNDEVFHIAQNWYAGQIGVKGVERVPSFIQVILPLHNYNLIFVGALDGEIPPPQHSLE